MTSTFGWGDISMFLCVTILFYNVSNYTFFDLFFSEFYRTLSIILILRTSFGQRCSIATTIVVSSIHYCR